MAKLLRLKRDLILTVIVELLTKIPLYGFEFLLASWLVIDQYAEWAALGLIYRIAPYAHLGALSYFNKRYPVLLGAGNTLAAKKIKHHTNSVINVLMLLFFSICVLFFLLGYLNSTAFVVFCGVLTMQIFTYCQAKVRNEGDFAAYAIGLIVFSLIQFSVAYFTIRKYGVFAGVMSTFLAYLGAVFYYIVVLKIDYLFFIPKRRNFNRVIKLGWAPFLLTISSFLTQISDRVALVCVDDDTKLAFYGFFALFFQIGIVAINSLGKVLGPYILHLSGRKKLSDTLSISLNTCYIILGLYFCMNLTLLIGGDWFIHQYFVKFTGGLLGVYNYATIGILLSLTLAFYPQLIVACKEFTVIKINVGYFLFSVTVIYFLAKHFPGFFIYSLGSFLMNVVYSVILLTVIENVLDKRIYVVRFTILFIFVSTLLVNYYMIT